MAKVFEPAIAENGHEFRGRLRRIAASGDLEFIGRDMGLLQTA